MNNRTVNVFVFGAGASFHVGLPLAKDLLIEGFNLLLETKYSVSSESFMKVANFLDRLYGCEVEACIKNRAVVSERQLPSVSIEELLTFVELGITNQETWLPFGNLRRALHDFIFETLDFRRIWGSLDSSLPWNAVSSNRRRNCYDVLVDNIINLKDENWLLSFNYDDFLDRAVAINEHGLLADYNLSFVSIENFPGYERIASGKRTNEDLDILKLHGSINWGRCDKCSEIGLAFHRKYRSYKQGVPSNRRTCNNCNSNIYPLLVPPIYRKQIENYGIDCLWDKAENALSRANHITIVGYSFPEPDIEAKWLFKKSLIKNDKKPTLTLVEPSPIVRNKVIGLFNKTIGTISIFEDFESYCWEKYKSA